MHRVLGSIVLASAALAAPGFAADDGTITVIGQGRAAAAPEFTRVRIEVTSICYDTSRAAKDANAVLANQVLAVLRNFTADPLDKVVATGGVNVLRTETIYVGTEPKVLCEMKWRATNSLILETKSISMIPDIQDQVLAAVDASAANPNVVAQTYAELDQPSFHLREATLKSLKRTAQVEAYDDAHLQYQAFQDRCQFGDPRLTTIEPPEYSVYARKGGAAMVSDGTNTPIIPDDLAVDASWKFIWTFNPVAGCPQ